MIQDLINNRLQLSSVRDRLHCLTKEYITNIGEFDNFVKTKWYKINQYNRHQIAELLAGNANGRGKNMNFFQKYINKIIKYEIR